MQPDVVDLAGRGVTPVPQVVGVEYEGVKPDDPRLFECWSYTCDGCRGFEVHAEKHIGFGCPNGCLEKVPRVGSGPQARTPWRLVSHHYHLAAP